MTWCVEMSRVGFFRLQNRLEERYVLNHGLKCGKWKKKLSQKIFWVRFFLSKTVRVMFLHVLEVFLVCFPRRACRERPMREHWSISNGSISNGSVLTISSQFRLFWVLEAVRTKTRETLVWMKVAYDIYKHGGPSAEGARVFDHPQG